MLYLIMYSTDVLMKKVKVSIIGIIDDRGRKFKISGLFDTVPIHVHTIYYFSLEETSSTTAAILADSLFIWNKSKGIDELYFLFVEPIRPFKDPAGNRVHVNWNIFRHIDRLINGIEHIQ